MMILLFSVMTVFFVENASSMITRFTQTRSYLGRTGLTSASSFQQHTSPSSSSSSLYCPSFSPSCSMLKENVAEKTSSEILYKEGTVTHLPWEESVKEDRQLTYMPLLKQQLQLMKDLGFKQEEVDVDMSLQTSKTKPGKIGNLQFSGGIFRKIRITYFDAGEGVQVFNTLWYPKYEYDIPMLGIDLISLGLNRVLNVMDFQPIHPTEEYSAKYIDHLSAIKQKYSDLQGVLSGKIYDDTQFFSKQMLFGRFKDEKSIKKQVFPAFEEYMNAYVELSKRAVPNDDPDAMRVIQQRQQQYDIYSALKDPAVGLFDAYFGKEWSHSFVHKFLFELSTTPTVGAVNPEDFIRPLPVAVEKPKVLIGKEEIGVPPVFQPLPDVPLEEVRAIPRGVGWALASAGIGAAMSAAQAILPPLDNFGS